jgi:hypothetical protein
VFGEGETPSADDLLADALPDDIDLSGLKSPTGTGATRAKRGFFNFRKRRKSSETFLGGVTPEVRLLELDACQLLLADTCVALLTRPVLRPTAYCFCSF